MSFHQIFKIRSLWPNYGSVLSFWGYNENVQLYPFPLLSSCMYAIKTISELQELVLLVSLTFTLKVKPIGAIIWINTWIELEASRKFCKPWKLVWGQLGLFPTILSYIGHRDLITNYLGVHWKLDLWPDFALCRKNQDRSSLTWYMVMYQSSLNIGLYPNNLQVTVRLRIVYTFTKV